MARRLHRRAPHGDVVVDKTMRAKRAAAGGDGRAACGRTDAAGRARAPHRRRGPRVLAENRVGARIVAGVPFAEYAAQPGQNVSTLKADAALAAALPARDDQPQDDAGHGPQDGRARRYLEPERFGRSVRRLGRRASRRAKDWEQFKADNVGRDI